MVVSPHQLTHCSFQINHGRFKTQDQGRFYKAIGGDSKSTFSTPQKLGKSFEANLEKYFLLVVLCSTQPLKDFFLSICLALPQVLLPRLDQQTSTKRFKVKFFFFFSKEDGNGVPKIPQFCFLGGILLAKSDLFSFFVIPVFWTKDCSWSFNFHWKETG